MQRRRNYQLTLWVMVALLLLVPALSASASGTLRYRHFPETGKTVGGAFLDFFDRYGGVHVDEYEVKFAEAVGTRWATGMSAGTAAVHSALGALRLEPGTEVISSPITDQGAVMPVIAQGCIPVFADASPECMNMSPEGIRAKLTDRTGAMVSLNQVLGTEELFVLSEQGDLIRTDSSTVSVYGRSSQGVTIKKVDGGDKVVSAMVLPTEEELAKADQ